MSQSKYVKNLSEHEMRLITKMRGINIKNQQVKLNYLGF